MCKQIELNTFKGYDNEGAPFNVELVGEGGSDSGGPRRDCLSSICKEIMSEVLPLFVRTSNNVTVSGKHTDLF